MFEAKGNIVESPQSDAGQGKVLLDKWLANTYIAIEKYNFLYQLHISDETFRMAGI